MLVGRLLARLETLLARRRWAVVALWILLLIVATPFALRQDEGLTGGGFAVPGSQSQRVEQQLRAGVAPEQRGVVLGAVLSPDRPRGGASIEPALRDLRSAARDTEGVTLPSTSLDIARFAAREHPGKPVLVPLVTTADEYGVPDVARDFNARLAPDGNYDRHGIEVHLVGQGALWAGLIELTKRDLRSAELLGFPAVALILLVVFGSAAAALVPLAVAAIAVAITGALILALSAVTTMNVYVTNMAAMIGIGVAVDYSLFVVVRFREELATGGARAHARARAMSTSGAAVVFSGLVVTGALASLFVVETAVLRSMALAAIVIVLVSMVLTLTLVPALLGLLGRRISPADPVASHRGATRWQRWARGVMRRPRLSLAASAALLLVLAAPAAGLVLGDGALRQFPPGNETRQGFEAAATVTSPGRGSPVKLLAQPSEVKRVLEYLIADPEVKRAGSRTRTRGGEVVIMAEPRHQGDSPQAKALVRRIRADLGAPVLVGGNSAAQLDFDDEVLGSLWLVALLTAALTFAVLSAMLRSVVLPLKAIATNLLSVAAAFGVLTVVFVWGWLDGLLGWDSPGYVDTFTVPLIVAAVFGLSMDYEVFLLSRIRERYRATGDTERSVTEALVSSARTITGAAAIMVAVFGVFIATGVPVIQEVGLGCAVAIFLDATVVRLVLVPAAMVLLGRWNWWWPGARGRARAAAVSTAVVVALLVVGCGGSSEPDHRGDERTDRRPAATTVASAAVRVSPSRAGTARRPQPVTVQLALRFRSPDRVEPPLLERATIELPADTNIDGGARPACERAALAAGGPAACPPGSLTGSGRLAARADRSPAQGTVTVVNGGPGKVWLHTVIRNPVRTEAVVEGSVAPAGPGRQTLALRFPEELQLVGGVPIAVRGLTLKAGAGRWLTTSGCPDDGRWAYRGRAVFSDGSEAEYADRVRCRTGV